MEPDTDSLLDSISLGSQRIIRDNRGTTSFVGNISVVKIKAAHHKVAQFVAQGLTNAQISILTGYAANYIQNLRTMNPAFAELVAHYTRESEQEMLDLRAKQGRLGELAVDELTDRLTGSPEEFTNRELIEMIESAINRPRDTPKGLATGAAPLPITIQFVTAEHTSALGPIIEGEGPKNE